MIAGLIERLTGRADQAPPESEPEPPAGVPDELVAAIQSASVVKRSAPDHETGETRIILRISGLGSFAWEGIGPAASRVARHYPELPSRTCRRAAQLIAGVAAREVRFTHRRALEKRGWVWSWQEFGP